MDEILKCDHAFKGKLLSSTFLRSRGAVYCSVPEVICFWPYKVTLTFESVDEILKCDHSNESY